MQALRQCQTLQLNRGEAAAAPCPQVHPAERPSMQFPWAHTHTHRLYPYTCDWVYISAQTNSLGTHVNTNDTSDLILFFSLADQMKICKWEIATNMYSVSGKQIQICTAWIPPASDTHFSQYMEFWCSHLQAPGQTSPPTPSGGSLQ